MAQPNSYIVQETGFQILLEDGSGALIWDTGNSGGGNNNGGGVGGSGGHGRGGGNSGGGGGNSGGGGGGNSGGPTTPAPTTTTERRRSGQSKQDGKRPLRYNKKPVDEAFAREEAAAAAAAERAALESAIKAGELTAAQVKLATELGIDPAALSGFSATEIDQLEALDRLGADVGPLIAAADALIAQRLAEQERIAAQIAMEQAAAADEEEAIAMILIAAMQ